MEISQVEPPYGTHSCSCDRYTFFYLFFYTNNVTNVTNDLDSHKQTGNAIIKSRWKPM